MNAKSDQTAQMSVACVFFPGDDGGGRCAQECQCHRLYGDGDGDFRKFGYRTHKSMRREDGSPDGAVNGLNNGRKILKKPSREAKHSLCTTLLVKQGWVK